MQTAHIVSDLILAVVGIFVFFRFLNRLNLHDTVLWEAFVLSAVLAAIFGAAGFAGFEKGEFISQFFQSLASITGGICLAAAAIGLVTNTDYSNLACYSILTLGFLMFVLSEVFGITEVAKWVPLVSMTIVALAAIYGLLKRKYLAGSWLLAAVAFFAMGQFRGLIFGSGDSTVDVFHILIAGGIFSLGLATAKK